MGADLLLATIEVREDEKAARARLSKMTFKESDIERFSMNGAFEFHDEEWDETMPERMRERLSECIGTVYASSRGSYLRDETYITIDGSRTFIVSGGASWGDEPSVNYDDFNLFNEFLGFPYWESGMSKARLRWFWNSVRV